MENEKSKFETSAEKGIRILHKLLDDYSLMLKMHRGGMFKQAYSLALAAEQNAEKFVILSRNLPAYTGCPTADADVEAIMETEIPIEMGYTEQGWFVLRIPMLLPKKEGGSVEYIRGYLYPAAKRFFLRKGSVRKYSRCVIIYRHIYDKDRPEREYRDHDNIETNMVTDTVAMFVMEDDSALKCSHFYCSEPGHSERTEVYVMPKEDFPRWIQMGGKFPEEGEKLHDLAKV